MSAIASERRSTLAASTAPKTERRRPTGVINVATALVGLGLCGCVAMAFEGESFRALAAPGGPATFAGRVAGLTGTFLLLIMVLLIARIPLVETVIGQDRLLRWHRRLGQWPIYLLVSHAVLITLGYAQQAHTGPWHQLLILENSYPDVLAATVALGLIIVAAIASIRAARRRMRYETWWALHLYMYLALALAFSHQIANGEAFVGHPAIRMVWAVLWAATAGTVLMFRVLMPLARSAWYGLKVVGVEVEAPGVVSVILSGRHVDRLKATGGQFFQWRFVKRELWWQAHPYSLSALPRPPYIRVTVKALGDHSAALEHLSPGTRVMIEGPYGTFTDRARVTEKVLLVGAGVGMTPIRALLEDLDPSVDVTVVNRASTVEQLLFRGEIRALVAARAAGRLHELVGPRGQQPLDERQLRLLVPDIAARDLYVCGPEPLSATVMESARRLGVPEARLHCEQFGF